MRVPAWVWIAPAALLVLGGAFFFLTRDAMVLFFALAAAGAFLAAGLLLTLLARGAPVRATGRRCASCGAAEAGSSAYCVQCGKPL